MAKKYLSKSDIIRNCVSSELSNMLQEFEDGSMDRELMLGYVSQILIDAEVSSDIVISIMELPEFGEEGKEEALRLKITLGY